MNYNGVIIEESLRNKSILKEVKIVETKVEEVTERHRTPWLKKWTLHTVEVSGDKANEVANKLSRDLDAEHAWYADFKNDKIHYIIFLNKVFKIDRSIKEEYDKARKYGMKLGIPEYQLDFSPQVIV